MTHRADTVLTYDRSNRAQRALRRFAATGPGSRFFAQVLVHIDRPVYRLTRGRHTFASLASGLPVVMLSTTGARSGQPRAVPVVGLPTSGGLAVIASNYGRREHPAWYHNLRHKPEGQVTMDGTTLTFRAHEADGDERARIWAKALEVYPGFAQYERRASHRRIGVFVLRTS